MGSTLLEAKERKDEMGVCGRETGHLWVKVVHYQFPGNPCTQKVTLCKLGTCRVSRSDMERLRCKLQTFPENAPASWERQIWKPRTIVYNK